MWFSSMLCGGNEKVCLLLWWKRRLRWVLVQLPVGCLLNWMYWKSRARTSRELVCGSNVPLRQEASAVQLGMVGGMQDSALSPVPGLAPVCPLHSGEPPSHKVWGGRCFRGAAKSCAGGSQGRLCWKSAIKWRGKREGMLLVIKSLVQHYVRACFLWSVPLAHLRVLLRVPGISQFFTLVNLNFKLLLPHLSLMRAAKL